MPVNVDSNNDKPKVSIGTVLWKSTIMAMILAIPSLGVFLGIYFGTGNLIVGAITGFVIHFVILAFSGRISKLLIKEKNSEGHNHK